jgi:hypothetical protein
MILHPAILALFASSLLTCLMVLYSTVHAVRILRRWDISSGSELQLALERRTYLISTIVSYFLVFQLVSLFLFVFTVDSICHLFVGAMCAVGTLTVNGFGYPTLILKTVTFLLAGLWLILNHADNLGFDYPLIRTKYLLLVLMTPLILAETVLQGAYFLGLNPDIITSCCGSLFSPASRSIATEVINAPPLPMLALFGASSLVTFTVGLWFYLRGTGGIPFALFSAVHFLVALVAVISVISLYIYQMPSHHCPFCILQKEYYFVGYPMYIAIFAAATAGIGAGWLTRYRRIKSLYGVLVPFQRSLTLLALSGIALLGAITVAYVLLTDFTLR